MNGDAVFTTIAGGIWKRSEESKHWTAIPGCANDISVAHDGNIYFTSKDGQVYLFNKDNNQITLITGVQNVDRIDGYDGKMFVMIDKDGRAYSNYGTP